MLAISKQKEPGGEGEEGKGKNQRRRYDCQGASQRQDNGGFKND